VEEGLVVHAFLYISLQTGVSLGSVEVSELIDSCRAHALVRNVSVNRDFIKEQKRPFHPLVGLAFS
jgi:hypothetical protein